MAKSPKDIGFGERKSAPYEAAPAQAGACKVALRPEHQAWVEQAVAEGRFASADAAIAYVLDQFIMSLDDLLDSEDDELVKQLIDEARNDPSPSISGEEMTRWFREQADRLKSK
jgi:Arc/MetJ-type ribon-helix-helix transcriptional regulator